MIIAILSQPVHEPHSSFCVDLTMLDVFANTNKYLSFSSDKFFKVP